MLKQAFSQRLLIFCLTTGLLMLSGLVSADSLDKIISEENARTDAAAKSQQAINNSQDISRQLLSEYKAALKAVDGLVVYNDLLQKQVDDQTTELSELDNAIQEVAIIERQIIPLMVRMIDSLEIFVSLDLPFLQSERTQRVDSLKKMMEQSGVTAAEKFRRVMEAYQIENDYGRTIEAYKGQVDFDGKQREVDFLRIGRTSLLFQTINRVHTGLWDETAKSWKLLPSETYRNQVTNGLKIARKQIAPDLLMLPVRSAKDSR